MQKDFSDYKFRASSLVNLLVDGRNKNGDLSETTKTFLRELWIKEVFGREKFVTTKFMRKGTMCESDSLDLVEETLQQTYFKNQKKLENEFITGTPDVIEKDFILDIKTSWDLWSFANVNVDYAFKCYYPQLLGYMWLTGKKEAKLAYCLVNTPDVQIEYELYKLTMAGVIRDTNEDQELAKRGFIFDDIDKKLRIKVYDYEFDEFMQTKLIDRINLARAYMNTLTL